MKNKRKLIILLASALVMALAFCAYAQSERDRALDRGLTSNDAYALSLIEKAKTSDKPAELIREAVLTAPDLPGLYFALAREALPNLMVSSQYVIEGINAYKRNLWWTHSLYGLSLVNLLLSLAVSSLVVALVRIFVQLPLLAHDINEDKKKFIVPLLLVPLSLGGPVVFAAGALIVAGIYLKGANKAVVYLSIVVLAASPMILKHSDSLLTKATSAQMKAIVAVNEGRDNGLALEVLSDDKRAESRFSYALALKRTGRYEEAASIYLELDRDQEDWRILNNLGNAYAAMNRTGLAKDTYSKAFALQKNPLTLYNLSQIYRGELDYATGDKHYADAAAMDQALVSRLTEFASQNPNRFVIDSTYTMGELWKMKAGGDERLLYPYPFEPLVMAVLGVLLLVLFLAMDSIINIRAFWCSRCGKPACTICGHESRSDELCSDCHKSFVKMEDVNRASRVESLLKTHGQKIRVMQIVRVLSFTIPGLAHIYLGKALSGMLLLWGFVFCILVLVLNPFIATGLYGMGHGWLLVPLAVAMLILYAISVISIGRRLDRGWL